MATEAAGQGFNTGVYNGSNIAYHDAQMLKAQLELNVKDAAATVAGADGAEKKSAEASVTRREGLASRKLPPPQSSLSALELSTRATGPPRDFEKYKGQKGKQSDKKC